MRYAFGYPRAALGVALREVAWAFVSAGLFVAAPAYVARMVLESPWRLIGIPYGVALGLVALLGVFWVVRGLVYDARKRFGVRLVLRFERRMDPAPETYFSGAYIARSLQSLDAIAGAAGVPSLSTFGLEGPAASEAWFDASLGLETIAAVLRLVGADSYRGAELERFALALTQADAAGIRFRVVCVGGTSMNAALWAELRDEGF